MWSHPSVRCTHHSHLGQALPPSNVDRTISSSSAICWTFAFASLLACASKVKSNVRRAFSTTRLACFNIRLRNSSHLSTSELVCNVHCSTCLASILASRSRDFRTMSDGGRERLLLGRDLAWIWNNSTSRSLSSVDCWRTLARQPRDISNSSSSLARMVRSSWSDDDVRTAVLVSAANRWRSNVIFVTCFWTRCSLDLSRDNTFSCILLTWRKACGIKNFVSHRRRCFSDHATLLPPSPNRQIKVSRHSQHTRFWRLFPWDDDSTSRPSYTVDEAQDWQTARPHERQWCIHHFHVRIFLEQERTLQRWWWLLSSFVVSSSSWCLVSCCLVSCCLVSSSSSSNNVSSSASSTKLFPSVHDSRGRHTSSPENSHPGGVVLNQWCFANNRGTAVTWEMSWRLTDVWSSRRARVRRTAM